MFAVELSPFGGSEGWFFREECIGHVDLRHVDFDERIRFPKSVEISPCKLRRTSVVVGLAQSTYFRKGVIVEFKHRSYSSVCFHRHQVSKISLHHLQDKVALVKELIVCNSLITFRWIML